MHAWVHLVRACERASVRASTWCNTVTVPHRGDPPPVRVFLEAYRGAHGLVEDTLEAFLSERRALNVRDGADVPPHLLSLSRRDRFLSLAPELLHALGVLSQVQSGAD
jgi:hypothetical protein